MQPKEILYISYTGMTEPLGRSQVLNYLQGLSLSGKYRFTILCLERPEFFEKEKEVIKKICADHHIEWHPLIYTNKWHVLSVLRRIWMLRTKARLLHKAKKFSIVHCRSYRSALVGLWMKEKMGTKFVFDMRGFWANERIDGGIWKMSNPLYRWLYHYFKKKEIIFLENADHIISLTENARQEIFSWDLKRKSLPISVIPCCVDTDLFNPENIRVELQDELRQKLEIPANHLVISYLGSLGTWYMLDEMLSFLQSWLKQLPESIFLFITNEPAEMIFVKAAETGLDKKNLRVISVNRQKVPVFLSLSNYILFFIKPAYSKKASSPVKQGEIMALGIPVICNSNVGDTAEIVKKYHAGYVIDELNDAAFSTAIKELHTYEFNRHDIRKGAIEFFSLESGIEKYDKVYEAVLENDEAAIKDNPELIKLTSSLK